MVNLSARERLILAIDTRERRRATELVSMAHHAGAPTVKAGLKFATAESWLVCSRMAGTRRLDWVADAKLCDIPETVAGAVEAFRDLPHPPVAITMHASAGVEAMRAAQETAGPSIRMLGVTVLTSIGPTEALRTYHVPLEQKVMEYAHDEVEAELAGVVCSPQEIGMIKSDDETTRLFSMVPGTRSRGADHHDQARVTTPADAIIAGADWLVIGRQVSLAEDPRAAFEAIVAEIEGVPPYVGA